jgi:SOS response regulatory protein OraA/RecX
MSEHKTQPKSKLNHKASRTYPAEAQTLQALRLIAAPNPKDDLSDEQLADKLKKSRFSTDLIKHLIDTVSAL